MRTRLTWIWLLFGICGALPAAAQGVAAKACGWVPLPALEAALGARPTPLTGTDRDEFHSCTFAAGAKAGAVLQRQAPGQAGLPRDVAAGLADARQLAGPKAQGFESQTFGDIGCYRLQLEMSGMPRSYSTSCFAPAGYVVLSLTRQDQPVPMPTVAELLKAVLPKAR